MNSGSVLDSFPVMDEVLNAIPHGIALLDVNLCLVAMNRTLEAMTGYMLDEVRGIYGDFVLRASLGNNDQVSREVLKSGEPVTREGNIINRARQKIPIHFTFTRLHDPGHNPLGIMILLEDMSATKAKRVSFQGSEGDSDILGHSRQMQEVFEMIAVFARTSASVLITGETGTGKDRVAEQLHKSSPRGRQPFIKVNCGALPEALLESELFGHVKGAFTGAVNDSVGMFRLANKGTIFLTEIGDLSLPLQVKLLSVLDDKAFYPVGGSKKIEVDVRVIAATHRSLDLEVKRGNFREDLFYRLNVLHLHIPPLREREGDIRLLLDHFLRQFKGKIAKNMSGFTQKSIDILTHYHYPGNVRELQNIVEYAVTICQERRITAKDLPSYLLQPPKVPGGGETEEFSSAGGLLPPDMASTEPRLQGWTEVEKKRILEVLAACSGNRSKAAEMLGWGRTTLWRKLKKYGLS
ncbi:MAG: sigma-54 interaction domain-containing protein [Desulforhopalus sp.]